MQNLLFKRVAIAFDRAGVQLVCSELPGLLVSNPEQFFIKLNELTVAIQGQKLESVIPSLNDVMPALTTILRNPKSGQKFVTAALVFLEEATKQSSEIIFPQPMIDALGKMALGGDSVAVKLLRRCYTAPHSLVSPPAEVALTLLAPKKELGDWESPFPDALFGRFMDNKDMFIKAPPRLLHAVLNFCLVKLDMAGSLEPGMLRFLCSAQRYSLVARKVVKERPDVLLRFLDRLYDPSCTEGINMTEAVEVIVHHVPTLRTQPGCNMSRLLSVVFDFAVVNMNNNPKREYVSSLEDGGVWGVLRVCNDFAIRNLMYHLRNNEGWAQDGRVALVPLLKLILNGGMRYQFGRGTGEYNCSDLSLDLIKALEHTPHLDFLLRWLSSVNNFSEKNYRTICALLCEATGLGSLSKALSKASDARSLHNLREKADKGLDEKYFGEERALFLKFLFPVFVEIVSEGKSKPRVIMMEPKRELTVNMSGIPQLLIVTETAGAVSTYTARLAVDTPVLQAEGGSKGGHPGAAGAAAPAEREPAMALALDDTLSTESTERTPLLRLRQK